MPHASSSLLGPIVVSACLGALIGLIRQWGEQAAKKPTGFAGVRTHTLWAVLGSLAAYANESLSPFALPVVFVLVSAQLIVHAALADEADHPTGSTGFAAALLTIFCGALVMWDEIKPAVVVAATTMVVLGSKNTIHAVTQRFTVRDFTATLQFVAITGVILPLVPDRDLGPFQAFNPYSTWLLVVLISGIGFAGYVAMRMLGPRAGLMLTSVLGGIASSTASTFAFSRRSKAEPALGASCAFAVVVACTVMLPRVIVAVSLINAELALQLVRPFAIVAVPAVGYGVWFALRGRRTAGQEVPSPEVTNPLSLWTAVRFGLLYAVISFLVRAASHFDWQSSLLPLSFVSGLTDLDAISLSIAKQSGGHDGTVPPSLAVQAIVLATVANSLLKAGIAFFIGSPTLRRDVAIVLGATALAGVGAMMVG
jgi:uncharacterized membrane protein (DUF4010 family)